MDWIIKIRNLFCVHRDNDVICWHYIHPNYGYYTTLIEVQLQCKKCGEYHIKYVYPKDFDEFVNKNKDKQWSNTCKPVID